MQKKDQDTQTITAAKAKADAAERTIEQTAEREQLIRERAYLKWQSRSGNNPVSEQETQQIWLEAEQEIHQEIESESK